LEVQPAGLEPEKYLVLELEILALEPQFLAIQASEELQVSELELEEEWALSAEE
jgi:hypothetical protein